MNYPPLYLRKNSERTVRNGHPWIFSGAVERRPKDAQNGDIVDVFDHRDTFVCRGFYNKRSLIRVRSLTRDPHQAIGDTFFQQRISEAVAVRRARPGSCACKMQSDRPHWVAYPQWGRER